jgi:hypothetical protein
VSDPKCAAATGPRIPGGNWPVRGPPAVAAGRKSVAASSIATPYNAPVAQLDRVSASEAEGPEFESRRAHHFFRRPNIPFAGVVMPGTSVSS